jgi:hypothetical protein
MLSIPSNKIKDKKLLGILSDELFIINNEVYFPHFQNKWFHLGDNKLFP